MTLVVLAVALVGSACSSTDGEPGAQGLDDSFYPNMGNGGYDVLHYEIDLDIDPAANTIQALATVTSRATQDLSAFNLDLSGLTVAEVQVNGSDAEFSRSGTELVIEPASSLASDTEFSTSVSYSGSPEPVVDPGVPFGLGWHHSEDTIYTVSEPSGSMSWFPSNNHPTDKATFEIRITVPATSTAASNGVLVEEISANGYTTTTWRMDDPMASYLAAVYVGDFERIETRQPGSPLIRDYVPRNSPAEIVEALSITPQAISYFEDLLGPYPFDAYGTIVLPLELGFALENQTLSVHGRYTIDPMIIAHEIIHQWLGNSSTLDDWSETWLHEGFATYLSIMYMSEHHEWDLNEQTDEWHEYLTADGSIPPMEIENSEMFDVSVYLRGALTLHALRGLVGETVFSDILRTHYEQSANSNTNTAEFLAVVTQLAGAAAAELVESWLYDDPMPPL